MIRGTLIFNIVILLLLLLFGISSRGSIAYPALLIIDSAVLAYSYRNERGLLLASLFIAYVHYSIAIGVYVRSEMAPQFYGQITNNAIYDEAIVSMILFTCILMLPCLSRSNNLITIRNNVEIGNCKINSSLAGCDSSRRRNAYKYSTPIEYGCLVAYLMLFFTQIDWSGGERMSFTALGEYRFLFAILGGLYSKKTRTRRIVWTASLLITSFLGFIGGNRVDSFPALLILLVVWYPNISIKKYSPWIIPGLIFFQLMGAIRGNISLLINFDFKELLSLTFENLFVQNTFIYAYFPSLAAIDLSLVQDAATKITNFMNNIIYIFVGGSYGKYTLSDYSHDFYDHAYGFIGSLYLNYWFGFIGSVVVGGIVTYIISKTKGIDLIGGTRSWRQFVYLCFICTLPRWYVYNFFALFRFIFLLTILYMACELLRKVLSSKRYS